MLEVLMMRALALLAAVLAVLVAWALAAGSGSWLQALAKLVLCALLVALARLAWRRPQGRPERARRRILRLAALVVNEEMRRDWAESTPSTDANEALVADLRAALREDPALLATAFDEAELALLADLSRALDADGEAAAMLGRLRPGAQAIQDAALARAARPVPRVGPRSPGGAGSGASRVG